MEVRLTPSVKRGARIVSGRGPSPAAAYGDVSAISSHIARTQGVRATWNTETRYVCSRVVVSVGRLGSHTRVDLPEAAARRGVKGDPSMPQQSVDEASIVRERTEPASRCRVRAP